MLKKYIIRKQFLKEKIYNLLKMKGENLMYNKVDSSKGIVNMEKDIAKLWTEKDIIKKSFDSNQRWRVFYFL